MRALDECFAQPCSKLILALGNDAMERLKAAQPPVFPVAGRAEDPNRAFHVGLRDLEASVARVIDHSRC